MKIDRTLPDVVDVAIYGAGPVGLTIANYLDALGIGTLVLEARDS